VGACPYSAGRLSPGLAGSISGRSRRYGSREDGKREERWLRGYQPRCHPGGWAVPLRGRFRFALKAGRVQSIPPVPLQVGARFADSARNSPAASAGRSRCVSWRRVREIVGPSDARSRRSTPDVDRLPTQVAPRPGEGRCRLNFTIGFPYRKVTPRRVDRSQTANSCAQSRARGKESAIRGHAVTRLALDGPCPTRSISSEAG
jgi:hypothetical protein